MSELEIGGFMTIELVSLVNLKSKNLRPKLKIRSAKGLLVSANVSP